MFRLTKKNRPSVVALRKESVDRNKYVVQCRKTLGVALRKESVDRNKCKVFVFCEKGVALRKESVDRNWKAMLIVPLFLPSLSARRAWIEMYAFDTAIPRYAGRSPQGERG